MLTILTTIPLVFIIFYYSIKKFIPEWSVPGRGFAQFENEWHKIFTKAGIIGLVIALMLFLVTEAEASTSILIGLVSGMLCLGSYTDFFSGKVPEELSNRMINISFLFGIPILAYNAWQYGSAQIFHKDWIYLSYGSDWALWVIGCVLLAVLGVVIYSKASLIVSVISIMLSGAALSVAFWISMRVMVASWFPPEAQDFATSFFVYGLGGTVTFVLMVVAFWLAVPDNYMGGADFKAMYAIGWGFAGTVGAYQLAIALLIACFVQIILHGLAKKYHFGHQKDIKVSDTMLKVNAFWWKITKKEGEPPTRKTVWAMPFLPVMNTTFILYTIWVITFGGLAVM